MQKPRVFIETYGCTFNQSDSDAIAGILALEGFTLVKCEEDADVILLNTCTVKGATEQKILYKLKRLVGARKRIVVAGCLPEANSNLVKKYAPAAPLLGTNALSHAPEAVQAAFEGRHVEFLGGKGERLSLPRFHAGAIARIPIADGCLGACTYCQTKLARGNLHSYPIECVVHEVQRCVELGCKEILLTAQDTGAYGLDIKTNLVELLQAVIEIPGDFKVRVGMMNPEHALRMLPGLLSVYESEKIRKFLHIPVQSGSDKVLRDMRRKYAVKDFLKIVKAFRRRFPSIRIATDIIVGYPTETEEDFKKTLNLLEKARFNVVNLSKFTPRPFTQAARLRQLPNQEVKRRSREAAEACRKISLERARS